MFNNDIGITVVLSSLLFILLLAGVIITIFVANRRNAKQEMKMVQMQIDYEKELRMVQVEVQEQVLINTGRELHDNIGHKLTFINLQLQQYRVMNPESGPLLETIGTNMIESVEELRRMSKQLSTDLFETQDLTAAINQEVQRLRQLNRFEVKWDYDAEPLLDKDQKVIVFRIFQEILNNIMKHAGCTVVNITLRGNVNFRMIVDDNGKGFDYAEIKTTGTGSGLKNMVKRAEMARLTCNIRSVIDKGTTFTLETI